MARQSYRPTVKQLQVFQLTATCFQTQSSQCFVPLSEVFISQICEAALSQLTTDVTSINHPIKCEL